MDSEEDISLRSCSSVNQEMYIKLEPPDKNEDSSLTLPEKSYKNHIHVIQNTDDEHIKNGHKDDVSDTVISLSLVSVRIKGPSDSCVKPESDRVALVESIETVERETNESDKALNDSVAITGENSKGKSNFTLVSMVFYSPFLGFI